MFCNTCTMTGTFPTALEIARAWAKLNAKMTGKTHGLYYDNGAWRHVEMPSSISVTEMIFPA